MIVKPEPLDIAYLDGIDFASVRKFLDIASERIAKAPNRIPFDPKTGNVVLAWLRARAINQP